MCIWGYQYICSGYVADCFLAFLLKKMVLLRVYMKNTPHQEKNTEMHGSERTLISIDCGLIDSPSCIPVVLYQQRMSLRNRVFAALISVSLSLSLSLSEIGTIGRLSNDHPPVNSWCGRVYITYDSLLYYSKTNQTRKPFNCLQNDTTVLFLSSIVDALCALCILYAIDACI